MSPECRYFWLTWCLCVLIGTAVGCGDSGGVSVVGGGLTVGGTDDGGTNGGDTGAGNAGETKTLAILRTVVEAPNTVSGSVSNSLQKSVTKADTPVTSATCTLSTISGTALATATSDSNGYCDFIVTPSSLSGDETVVATATVDGTTLGLVTILTSVPTFGTTTSIGSTGPSSSVVAQMIFTSCESASGRTVTISDPAGCATADDAGSISLPAMIKAMDQLRVISEASGSTDTDNASGAFGALLSNFRIAIGRGAGTQYLRTAIDESNYASLKQTVLAATDVLTDATLISNVDQSGEWGTIAKCLATWSGTEATTVAASPTLVRNMMKEGSAETGGLDFCKSSSGAKAIARMSEECGSQGGNTALYPLLKSGSWSSVEDCNATIMGSAICNLAKGASDSTSRTFAHDSATSIMSSVRSNPLAFAGTTGTTVASRLLFMGAGQGYSPSGLTFCRSNSDCGSGRVCSITNTCVSNSVAIGSNLPLGMMCDSDAKCASGNCSVMVSSGNRFCAPTDGFTIPTSGPASPQQYELSISPVELSISSCLAAPSTDAVTPAVLATNPTCGSNNFPVNQTFRITFNQPMDAATINASTIAVTSQDGPLDGTVTYSGTSALFTPSTALQNGFTYTLTASTDAKNQDGVSLSSPFSCAMTTIQAAPTALVAAQDTAMVIKAGRVWAWGRNNSGQLGDGTIRDRNEPQPIAGLYGIQQVATHQTHSLALKTDGTVWAWGDNRYGQLGDGTTTVHRTPALVPGLSGVSKIGIGSHFSAALKDDGTVWTWGFNSSGQLGNTTLVDSPTPVQVVGTGGAGMLTGVSDIVCGLASCFAVKSDGSVWSWGSGLQGRLGDGTLVNKSAPVQVKGVGNVGTLSGVIKISCSQLHTVALLSNNTVVGWGYNGNGQLGDGTTAQKTYPVAVLGLTGVSAISAGNTHTLAIKNDYTAWAWGQGTAFGLLGNFPSATQVTGITDVSAASAGSNYSVFQKRDNSIEAIGSNVYGALGDGATALYNSKGYVQTSITGVTQLGDGGCGTLHAFTPGSKWVAWGRNNDAEILAWDDPASQIGWGNVIYPPFLGAITPQYVATGCYQTLALMTDGTVRGWGRNSAGQLGDGTTIGHSNHTTAIGGLSNIIQVNPGRDHAMAVKNDGTVWTWGYNAYKQIGNGLTTNRLTPYQVAITNVVDGAASHHTLAVKTDGTVWAWGYNFYGQLGNGGTTNQGAPIQVLGEGGVGTLSGVSKVGITLYHSVAVKTDGTVWAWGLGSSGQLGNGAWGNSGSPVQVSGLTNVDKVCKNSSGNFSAVIKSDGTVWAWGDNTYGQLGSGDTSNRNIPTQVVDVDGVTPITNATDVACGISLMVVLTQDGRVIEWGYDTTTPGLNPAGETANITTLLDVVWP